MKSSITVTHFIDKKNIYLLVEPECKMMTRLYALLGFPRAFKFFLNTLNKASFHLDVYKLLAFAAQVSTESEQ